MKHTKRRRCKHCDHMAEIAKSQCDKLITLRAIAKAAQNIMRFLDDYDLSHYSYGNTSKQNLKDALAALDSEEKKHANDD